MNKLIIGLAIMFFYSCDRIEKAIEDPKVQKDSISLVEDVIDLGEDVIKDETGLEVDIHLPMKPSQAKSNP